MNLHAWGRVRARKRFGCTRTNGSRLNADALDKFEGELLIHQELGLLALLDIRVSEIPRCYGVSVELIQFLYRFAELGVVGARVG